MQTQQLSESSVRRVAKRHGYYITKSRRALSIDNAGEYMLIEVSTRAPVLGWRYDATLEAIAEWFNED
jgi:hypothetical protein